ncbi:hypothetical protein [Streptomyces kronopolitis]|uniref:hypothetical protein n=1 Tax=Streptomyces kronopolitis TaxID=1612435 RepID=UPI003D9634F8
MELTTVRECAQRWGLSDAAARRILAPLASVDRHPDTGAKRYQRESADAARAAGPGQGHRTDLADRAEITVDEYRALIADETIPLVHRALFAMLWESDLRVTEALDLDVRDVAEGEEAATTDGGRKTGPRTVPLPGVSAELVRRAIDGRDEGPLLRNSRGGALNRSAASWIAHKEGYPLYGFRAGGKRFRALQSVEEE